MAGGTPFESESLWSASNLPNCFWRSASIISILPSEKLSPMSFSASLTAWRVMGLLFVCPIPEVVTRADSASTTKDF